MTHFKPALTGILLITATASSAQQIVIDNFDGGDQTVTLSTAPGTEVESINNNGGALANERTLRVSGSSVGGGNIVGAVGSGNLTFNRPSGSTGQMDIWWDGDDDDTSFNATGLGGVDLTANSQDRFRLTVNSSSSGAKDFRITVWTDGGNQSQLEQTLPTGGGTVEFLYSNFTGSADFTNVGAIFLTTSTATGITDGWSFSIAELRTTPVELQHFSIE